MNIIELQCSSGGDFFTTFVDIKLKLSERFGPIMRNQHSLQGHPDFEKACQLYETAMGTRLNVNADLVWISVFVGEKWAAVGFADMVDGFYSDHRIHIGIEDNVDAVEFRLTM